MKKFLLKYCATFCLISICLFSFVACDDKNDNNVTVSYYSLEEIKTVIDNTAQIIKEKESTISTNHTNGQNVSSSTFIQSTNDGNTDFNPNTAVEILDTPQYFGNLDYIKSELMESQIGSKIYDSNNYRFFDIFRDTKSAIKGIKGLIEADNLELLSNCAEYKLDDHHINMRFRITAYKSQLRIDVYGYGYDDYVNGEEIQKDCLIISFDEDKNITSICAATKNIWYFNGENIYAIYDIAEDKIYSFKPDCEHIADIRAEIASNLDEVKNITSDKLIVTDRDVSKVWINAISS